MDGWIGWMGWMDGWMVDGYPAAMLAWPGRSLPVNEFVKLLPESQLRCRSGVWAFWLLCCFCLSVSRMPCVLFAWCALPSLSSFFPFNFGWVVGLGRWPFLRLQPATRIQLSCPSHWTCAKMMAWPGLAW